MISSYKDSNKKVVYCLPWVIRQNVIHQLATSSENLVTSTQFLVALATSESQFQALCITVGLYSQGTARAEVRGTPISRKLRGKTTVVGEDEPGT